MKKYGVNWVLYCAGYVLALQVFCFWLWRVLIIALPYKPGEHHLPWYVFGIFPMLGHLWHTFSTARKKARSGVLPENTPTARDRVDAPVWMFGAISALVGVILIVFPPWAAQVGTPTVIGCAVGVPLCSALGSLLMQLAKDTGPVSPVREGQPQQAPTTMVMDRAATSTDSTVVCEDTDEARVVLLARGR